MDKQEWTVQRHSKQWAHKTQDKDKQNNTKTKKISNTDPIKKNPLANTSTREEHVIPVFYKILVMLLIYVKGKRPITT